MTADLFLIDYLHPLARKLQQIYPVGAVVKKIRSRWKMQHSPAALLPEIVKDIPAEVYRLPQGIWRVHLVTTSETNRTIAFLGPVYQQPPVVIKMPGSRRETESLMRQVENLRLLSSEKGLGQWWRLLPVNMYRGEVGGQVYFIERAMPGTTMLSLLQNEAKRPQVINLAADEISHLHLATAHGLATTDRLVERWVQAPLHRVAGHLSSGLFSDGYHRNIAQLNMELCEGLLHRQIAVSWIHGDYCPSNILVNPAGNKVTGIVDWDLAAPDEYPLLDLMHLLISVRMETTGRELGQIVADLLVHQDWTPFEIQLIRKAEGALRGDPLDLQVVLLLCWLRHIKGNLDKTSRFDHDPMWAAENIMRVLRVY